MKLRHGIHNSVGRRYQSVNADTDCNSVSALTAPKIKNGDPGLTMSLDHWDRRQQAKRSGYGRSERI